MTTRKTLVVGSALLLLGLGSCTSPRFYDHRFRPAPAEAEVGPVRALVTVIGIERPQDEHGARAILRMRLENLGNTPAKLETESLSLLSADLAEFGPAQIASAEAPGEIDAGENAAFDMMFPLPEGRKVTELDLSGLNLRFTVRIGDHPVTAGTTFQLLEVPYWDPGYHVTIGMGYSSD